MGGIIFILAILALVFTASNLSYSTAIQNNIEEKKNLDYIKNYNYSHIEESINKYYDNNYHNIHIEKKQSDFVKKFDELYKNDKKLYFFNNKNFYIYDMVNDEFSTRKPISGLLTDLSLVSPNDDNVISIINDFINLAGNEYFIAIGSEYIINLYDMKFASLDIYLAKTKDLNSIDKNNIKLLNTTDVINKKLLNIKKILNNIYEEIGEFGKRTFKGLSKMEGYSAVNFYSNLGEGIMKEISLDGVNTQTYPYPIGRGVTFGFQTTDVLYINNEYMNSLNHTVINNLAQDFSYNNAVVCEYKSSVDSTASSVNYYDIGAFYNCKLDFTNGHNINTPDGYCGLKDNCGIKYTITDNIINGYTIYDLKDTLKEKMHIDLSMFKNPFFPNQSLSKNSNFILSSSNGGRGSYYSIKLNLGMRVINRDSNMSEKSQKYFINKYDIIYK